MSDEEWGPWIEHDGKGCRCRGEFVNVVRRNGAEDAFRAETKRFNPLIRGNPLWCNWTFSGKPSEIVRYRIRKPRGLTILESLLTDLPEKVDA